MAEPTHSENLLTQNVLLLDQREAGYYLREDDHCIYIYKGDKRLTAFSLYVTSDKIREEVDRLRNVLTREQRAEGYHLEENDRHIFICKNGKRVRTLSHTTSNIIREIVDELRKGDGKCSARKLTE